MAKVKTKYAILSKNIGQKSILSTIFEKIIWLFLGFIEH